MQEKKLRRRFFVLGYGGRHYIRILRHISRRAMLAKRQESLHEQMNCL